MGGSRGCPPLMTEMADAEPVIAKVVQRVRREQFLDAIQAYCIESNAFERWLGYADRQAPLFFVL